jgi:hypothetical protein
MPRAYQRSAEIKTRPHRCSRGGIFTMSLYAALRPFRHARSRHRDEQKRASRRRSPRASPHSRHRRKASSTSGSSRSAAPAIMWSSSASVKGSGSFTALATRYWSETATESGRACGRPDSPVLGVPRAGLEISRPLAPPGAHLTGASVCSASSGEGIRAGPWPVCSSWGLSEPPRGDHTFVPLCGNMADPAMVLRISTLEEQRYRHPCRPSGWMDSAVS